MKKKLKVIGIIMLLLFAMLGLVASEWHLELVHTVGGETALSVRNPESPYTFYVFDDHARLERFSGNDMSDVKIPKTFWGKPVTAIGNGCFAYSSITAVELHENIETIEGDAFEGCKNLQEVTGGVHVKTIGERAFKGCENLVQLDVGNEVNRIYYKAFYGCTNLKTIGEQEYLKRVETSVFEKSGMESNEMY